MFVRSDIPPLVRDELCPLADIITPNHFEFEFLCGARVTTIDDVVAQASALMARGPQTIVITSAELAGTPQSEIETLAIERTQSDKIYAWRVRTPRVPISPSGTGDLFAALFVAARARGLATPDALSHAASGIYGVLERTAQRGTEEMRIIESAGVMIGRS